jgi:hypothetical protein
MKTAARFLLLASTAVLAAGCTTLAKDPFAPMHPHWSDFSSRQARHYANFPGKTKQRLSETRTVSGQTAATYLRELEVGGRYYGTAWTQVPGDTWSAAPRDRILEVAAAEAVKSTGGKLVSKLPVAYEGNRGLEYVIDLPKDKMRLRQKIFLVTGVLVEQTYTGPAGSESEREPGRFFESLKLLP